MSARISPPDNDSIAEAVSQLEQGEAIGLPTETVYGLAADAANPDAIARIYAVKARPSFNPLIAHVASLDMAKAEAIFTEGATALASAFWPGPLTLVLDCQPGTVISQLARAGLDTIAIRFPAHPAAQSIIAGLGRPVVAPSANPSGKLSPTQAQHVAHDLGASIDLILDGGPCEAGLESTIIDARSDCPVLLRAGPIAAEEIEAVWPGLEVAGDNPDSPLAPGQLLRHYAPNASLRLNASGPESGEGYLGFGDCPATLNLSPNGEPVEAAANLFDYLRRLDEQYTRIAVAPIAEVGLGAAINDRLRRAANLD